MNVTWAPDIPKLEKPLLQVSLFRNLSTMASLLLLLVSFVLILRPLDNGYIFCIGTLEAIMVIELK